ncbi:MAG TPA: helix-hairpin-helix domain-containing protein [Bacteroidota bacterium]|nr:helix-hairpin-helix domain-containing protein [Bacteroidota bacterium]
MIKLLLCVSALQVQLVAQESSSRDSIPRSDPEAQLERVLEEATQDAEDSQLIDLLSQLSEQPLDLNTASAEELTQIPEISPMLALEIVSFRQNRPFRAVDELLLLENVTPDLLQRVRPFLSVSVRSEPPLEFPIRGGSFRTRSVEDLQNRKGFTDGTFLGSPLKLYNRFIARSRPFDVSDHFQKLAFEVGLLTEKDAGERSLTDFKAGYVDVNLSSSRVIVGDFAVETGEGMVFWRSIGFSKGSNVISGIRKRGSGIRPYLSTDENMYLRGIAAQHSLGTVQMTVLYSEKPLNGSVDGQGVVTGLYSTGLFRSASEEQRRGSFRERLLGGILSAEVLSGLQVRTSGYSAEFSRPVSLSSDAQRFGRNTSAGGVDIAYTGRHFSLFAEAAMDENRTFAGVGGLLYQPRQDVSMSLLMRSYPAGFLSFHGFGFGESSGPPQNESGFYVGAKLRIAPWWIMSTYVDQFIFPRHSTNLRLRSGGHDLFTLSDFRLGRKTSLQLQMKWKEKETSTTVVDASGRLQRVLTPRKQENYRITLDFNPSITFRWRSRVEMAFVSQGGAKPAETGLLVFQDVRIIPISRLLMNARVIMFDTDSFESRVYEFENDLPGSFSNPALFDKGMRWYVMMRYEVAMWMDISAKYSHTIKDRARTISSGASEILGDVDNRLSFQLDILFR